MSQFGEVGHVEQLTRLDDCDCDECDTLAIYRLTVATGAGKATLDLCKDCYTNYRLDHPRQKE